MKKFRLFRFSFLLSSLIIAGNCLADNFIAVSKDGKVYDEASAKYVTLNQDNDEVNVIPGMVFKTTEHAPGWYLVEYSPGLRAYIPDQIVANSFVSPKPGTYKISNNPSQTLSITQSGDNWNATLGAQSYTGSRFEDVVVFNDSDQKIAFSLVDLGNGPIVISYDNDVTKFF